MDATPAEREMGFAMLLHIGAEAMPAESRARDMVAFLGVVARSAREEGVPVPAGVETALERYRKAVEEGRGDLTPEEMLRVIDGLLAGLPEEKRPAAKRTFLEWVARTFLNAGRPVPEWVRVGLA